MSLDAANGAVDGVKVLAMQAMQAEATKEEVMQIVRITQYICGTGSFYTASAALENVLLLSKNHTIALSPARDN